MPERQPAAATPYAWYVVAVLTLANVSGFVDRQILSLLVPAIKRDLGVSDSQISYLIGLSFAVFYSVLGLPIARWADRGHRGRIMAAGVALWSLMTMLSGTAGTYGRLLLTRIGVGVGEASLAAPSVALLADYFPRERRASALSVYSLGVFLGSGLAYFLGGWTVGLVSASGSWVWPVVGEIRPWQSVFIIVGAPGLLVALLLLTIRETRPPGAPSSVRRDGADPRSREEADTPRLLPHVVAHRRAFLTHGFGFALSAAVNYGIAAWLATFLIRAYGWTPARAGMTQGVLTMTVGVVGVLAGGRATDALVRRGRADAPLRVGIIGAAGMLVSATAYPLMPTAALAVAWLVVVNFFAAFPWGAASAAAVEMVPATLRAQGAALFFVVLNLVSAAVGPTAVAWLTDYLFRDEALLGRSLALANAVGMTLTITLLAYGLPAFRRTVQEMQVERGRQSETGRGRPEGAAVAPIHE